MFAYLHRWSRHLAARLPAAIPSSCALCGSSGEDGICDGCRQQFLGTPGQRCSRCAVCLPGTAAAATGLCGACLREPPAFDATIAAADYAPPVDQLVLALKFGGRLALAPLLARMLRDATLRMRHGDMALPTLLTAVPLGPQRLAERGFNQALEIAKPLSYTLGIQLAPHLLVRLRDTRAQSLLHPAERHENIRRAFIVPNEAIDNVRGRHIGVVDDVVTTGETLHEIAATLKRFGAVRVTNFVFARTLPK
jgi:ComF family protein